MSVDAPVPNAGAAQAPLLVGITGKLDLQGAEDAVRAALEMLFARLDARCPHTPKVLLSALAKGADTLAAETALARPGWSVIAPLPMTEALFLEDFDASGAERLRALLGNPKVRKIELDALRRTEGGERFEDGELSRADPAAGPLRADHYEQGGLWLAERSAVLIAVMEAGEQPAKIGGSARIVHQRLSGELDAHARDIVRRSDLLFEPPRLADRLDGPVWVIDLARLIEAPREPTQALLVADRGQETPAPVGAGGARAVGFTLADSLEAFNHRLDRMNSRRRSELERRAGATRGDASAELRRLRIALSLVQGDLVTRVRRMIWVMAVLSSAAILCFELYAELTFYAWSRWFSIAYSALLIAAILIYWFARRQRWQRLAEDYRAAAEALRVQLVWWASGIVGRDQGIGACFLRGAHGSFAQLRILTNHLIDGALLLYGAPAADASAAETWVVEQLGFFHQRIAARRRELATVEGASWFLLAASIGVAACLALMQIPFVPSSLFSLAIQCGLLVLNGFAIAAGVALVGLLWISIRGRVAAEAQEPGHDQAPSRGGASEWIAGAAAGVILTLMLCDMALIGTAYAGVDDLMGAATEWAKKMVAIAVILPAAIAGALRFVADKSSWAAELAGYEQARERFRRGRAALAETVGAGAREAAERREIVLALGEEALRETGSWLRAHRERPLEPIVGG
jgi:hypothetical protein